MSPLSADDAVRALAALILFSTWVALIVWKVDGAADLIATIKLSLVSLASHWLTLYNPTTASGGTTITLPKP